MRDLIFEFREVLWTLLIQITISKASYGFLNSSKKPMKVTILSTEDAQVSEFYSGFFEELERKNVAIYCDKLSNPV